MNATLGHRAQVVRLGSPSAGWQVAVDRACMQHHPMYDYMEHTACTLACAARRLGRVRMAWQAWLVGVGVPRSRPAAPSRALGCPFFGFLCPTGLLCRGVHAVVVVHVWHYVTSGFFASWLLVCCVACVHNCQCGCIDVGSPGGPGKTKLGNARCGARCASAGCWQPVPKKCRGGWLQFQEAAGSAAGLNNTLRVRAAREAVCAQAQAACWCVSPGPCQNRAATTAHVFRAVLPHGPQPRNLHQTANHAPTPSDPSGLGGRTTPSSARDSTSPRAVPLPPALPQPPSTLHALPTHLSLPKKQGDWGRQAAQKPQPGAHYASKGSLSSPKPLPPTHLLQPLAPSPPPGHP